MSKMSKKKAKDNYLPPLTLLEKITLTFVIILVTLSISVMIWGPW